MSAKNLVNKLLSEADIQVNGNRPWDIQIHDERFYNRVLSEQSLGLGESYIEGWWDCSQLDEMFSRLFEARLDQKIKQSPSAIFAVLSHRLFNHQTKDKAKLSIQRHYDLGNDLFQAMLDKEMNYSCAFWHNATHLDEAQQNKLELICQKLQMSPGMRLLDIGCGWGSLAKYAATHYGVEVVGITISENQKNWAINNCRGLPITIQLLDYRDVIGEFDRIVSVGMFEHVGYKNYSELMNVVHKHLNESGIFLLHTIGSNVTSYAGDPWINRYIFPNGMIPSITQIGKAIEPYFVMEDWHNFGAYYDKTLMAWNMNFQTHWNELKSHYNQTFYRMWSYYLLFCAALFRTRQTQLWQIILSKNGLKGGYHFRY